MSTQNIYPQTNLNILQDQFKNVVSLFKAVSESIPDKTAIISELKSLTYVELDRQSDKLALRLAGLGVESGSSIAVCMSQSVERIVAFLAVLKIGAAYIPIDSQLPESRIKIMMEDATAALIIVDNLHVPKFLKISVPLINVDKVATEQPENDLGIFDAVKVNPEDKAYIVYTSGSTGVPKGVGIHHGALYAFVKSLTELWGFSCADRTLQFSSVSFDVSVIDIWIPLLSGATIVLYPDNKVVGKALLDFIIDHEIDTVPFLPPAVLSTLPTDIPIGSLHTIAIGGESSSEQTVKNWCNRVRLINLYGPSEATVGVTTHHFQKENPNPHIIGKPLDSVDIYILDQTLDPVSEGVTGEIYIGGKQLAKGYINKPLETAAAFIQAPKWLQLIHGQEYCLYKSGDRAFWRRDGDIEYVGRLDDQIKLRGFRIELKEIEHHIGQLEQVSNTAVKVHHPEIGSSMLVAFIVLHEAHKSNINLEDIRNRLKQSIPLYMLPERIIIQDKLPLMVTGKVDKSKLDVPPQRFVKKSRNKSGVVDLRSELVEIWMDLLNIDDISEDDNFFELGGHSLMLAQLHDRLPVNVQKKMPFPELYSFPTINLFVKEVESRLLQNEITQQQKADMVKEQLLKDAQLPFEFEITEQPDPKVLTDPSTIFLTGATGFVGSHLLEELILKNPNAIIYCLVRASNEELALERIKNTFLKFNLIWNVAYDDKIKVVLGDLTKTNLGVGQILYNKLLKDIEVIYHMGSDVSYVQPYEYIKKPNVDGMAHILHLAVHDRVKFLIISSSIGVYSWGRAFTGKTWMTEDDPIEQNLPAVCRDMGYIRSKWVMDSMADKARKKGLPLINFRLGFVVCHSETGATPLNQWWSSLMRSCIEVKAFPLIMGLKDQEVTVDFVCKAIAHISQKPTALGLNFNLTPLPEHDLSLTDFCVRITEYCGLEMKGLDFHKWLEQWRRNQETPLFPLLYLFTDDAYEGKTMAEAYENTYYLKSTNTDKFLEDTDIRPAIFNKQVMERYLRFMKII